jgi:hypothetical protein
MNFKFVLVKEITSQKIHTLVKTSRPHLSVSESDVSQVQNNQKVKPLLESKTTMENSASVPKTLMG